MNVPPQLIEPVLDSLENWLGKPRQLYQADVLRFATILSPAEVLEAVMIAQTRIPGGGRGGFKYFCGVCHRKIDQQQIDAAWAE